MVAAKTSNPQTALLNPLVALTVTMEVAKPPAVTEVGESTKAEMPKLAGDCTTRDTGTLCAREPEVPTTATA